MRVIRDGDRAYVVALRPPHVAIVSPSGINAWLLNIRANPTVRVVIHDGAFEGLAREITEPAEHERARAAICDTVYPTDYAECLLHLRGLPSRTKIQELHRYWFRTGNPVVIELKENHVVATRTTGPSSAAI